MYERGVNEEILKLAHELEADLYRLYQTPMLSGSNLQKALGFSSINGYRQAQTRKKLPIPVFQLENRRGSYALVKDVAFWLAEQSVLAKHKRDKEK